MRSNTLTGTLGGTRDIYREIDGEKFYKTSLTMNGEAIPIVASEYVLKDLKGKCRVHCILKQDAVEDSQHRETYLYAAKIESVDSKTADVNRIYLGGRIVEVFPPRFVGTLCVEEIVFKILYHMRNSVVIVNVSALGKNARMLSQARRDNVINAACYLSIYNDAIKINIINCTLRESLHKKEDKNTTTDENNSNSGSVKKKKFRYHNRKKQQTE